MLGGLTLGGDGFPFDEAPSEEGGGFVFELFSPDDSEPTDAYL